MDFLLQNTLSGLKEKVFPADGEALRFYCCGPTVYGPAHIGNFRTFTIQDLFRRTAEAVGIRTCHVRNLTDVDDKTIRESQKAGLSLKEFTDQWTRRFEADCKALNLLEPHHSPSAVLHIPQQIELIQRLVDKGLAYKGHDGSVYFRISAFPDYGKLSGLCREGLVCNADGRLHSEDEYGKEDYSDFALWKGWKEEDGPNRWESPWGPGRPGWHIECSAMSMHYLGESYDVHSGGVDLVFPHHENEIAQSEGATGKPFARHWFHPTHLRVEGQKMSKSLGNLYTLDDICAKGFSPEELRYVLISGHFRQPLNFTWDSLHAARSALQRLQKFRAKLCPNSSAVQDPVGESVPGFGIWEPVMESLADDLNAAQALGRLFTLLPQAESSLSADPAQRATLLEGFDRVMFAFGLKLDAPAVQEVSVEVPEEVRALAEERWQAKQSRDWAKADTLRGELASKGWIVKDAKDGYSLSHAAG